MNTFTFVVGSFVGPIQYGPSYACSDIRYTPLDCGTHVAETGISFCSYGPRVSVAQFRRKPST